jgi:hypothetical protein
MITLLEKSRGNVTIELPDKSIIHAGLCDFTVTMDSSGNFSMSLKVLGKDGYEIDRAPLEYKSLLRKIRT